ncbi:hypothetical protein N9S30_00125 [bacterium]|nr:hypothetical protein [bacterium]
MWFLILPSASVAIFGILLAIARKKDNELEAGYQRLSQNKRSSNDDDIEMQGPPTTSSTKEGENDEEDVVVVTDVLGWIHDASDRILLSSGPEVKTVGAPGGNSTFIVFTARGIEFELWLGGPLYLSPFPRLKQALDDGPGIQVERSQASIERSIVAC